MAFMRSPVRSRLAPPSNYYYFGAPVVMNRVTKFHLFYFLCCLSLFSLLFIFCISSYGIRLGTHLVLLMWSMYILCIPGSHGQLLFGLSIHSLKQTKFYTEPFMWSMAILFNIITYSATPHVYLKTIPTKLLYRIISTPNPYWIIVFISTVGTFYNFATRENYFETKSLFHKNTRRIIIFAGILTFFYLSYKEAILILNAAF